MGKRLSGEGSSARPSRLVPELSVRKYLQTPSPLTSKSIFEPAGGQGNASGPSRFRPPRPVRSAAPETETLSPLGPQRPLPTPAGWDNIPLDLYSAPFRLSATQQTGISSISGRAGPSFGSVNQGTFVGAQSESTQKCPQGKNQEHTNSMQMIALGGRKQEGRIQKKAESQEWHVPGAALRSLGNGRTIGHGRRRGR